LVIGRSVTGQPVTNHQLPITFRSIIEFPVNGRDLLYPAVALEVIQFKQILRRPVKVIRQIGYLFVELL